MAAALALAPYRGQYDPGEHMKRIAVIGSGISGLTAAHLLSQQHDVTLYEAEDRLGGHTATVDVQIGDRQHAIDTGFIVFNDWTYPNFNKLLERTGVAIQATEMSFSVQHQASGIEYNGNNLSTLFAQRANLLSPKFYTFIGEILRFNKLTKQRLANGGGAMATTLGDFLQLYRFSEFFAVHYILPMVAAIWSSSIRDARVFPLDLFLRFFNHHGLLNVIKRPQWYVIKNGSRSYIPGLVAPVQQVRTGCPVLSIKRLQNGVRVVSVIDTVDYDDVVLACHSDQALKMLTDCSYQEKRVLGALHYRDNDVVLHTDTRLLPENRRAWASWNFWQGAGEDAAPAVTYNMNILQGIDAEQTFCVTLNRSEAIDPDKILGRYRYAHPVYDSGTLEAQQQRETISGHNHTHFCGAYWYNGFHEDGVRSALDVCRHFGIQL